MRRLFITLIMVLSIFVAKAQDLKAYAEYDYNRTAKSRANFAIASGFQLADNMHLDLGLQIGTQNRYAFNIAYQLDLIHAKSGKLFMENRYLYRLFPSYNQQEFNAMLDFGWSNRHWNFQLGLCNRYIAEIPLRINGGEGVIFEPMNVVFNIEGNLFDQNHPWNIGCGISNYREFIIERVTLFYYTVHGYYDINKQWRINAEAGLHPAGVLNLSSQYNGFFFNIGCTYKH